MLMLLIIHLINSGLTAASFVMNLTEKVEVLQRRVMFLNNKGGKWWSGRINPSMALISLSCPNRGSDSNSDLSARHVIQLIIEVI